MEREEPSGGQVRVWDAPVRLFHWLLVAAVALALLSSDEDSALNQWHVLSGWVAAILVVFRIVWGFAGGEHSRFGDFLRPPRDRVVIDAATFVGNEARSDLDDEPPRGCDAHVSRRLRSRIGAGVTTSGVSPAGDSCAAGGCASSQSCTANVSSRQPEPSIAAIANIGPS